MKRFLILYILLLPGIVFGVMYFCYFTYTSLPVPTYSLQRLYLWLLSFGLIFLSFVSGIIALTAYGASYAAKMSLIEASIWNILIKISYFFIHIGILQFWNLMWESSWWKSVLWEFIFEMLVPPLFILFFWVISSVFSVIIFIASGKKGVWTNGIVILFGALSFIFGIDFILAIIHICKCCIKEEEKYEKE